MGGNPLLEKQYVWTKNVYKKYLIINEDNFPSVNIR